MYSSPKQVQYDNETFLILQCLHLTIVAQAYTVEQQIRIIGIRIKFEINQRLS